MPLAAQVAVSEATVYYDKLYTYAVPTPMEGHIFVGSMVLVPFGRGKTRPRTGVVLALNSVVAQDARTKELHDVAPEDACLTDELLTTVKYLKQATFCTWFEAVRAVIPYGAQYKAVQSPNGWVLQKQISRHTEPLYELAEEPPIQSRKPSAAQQAVLELLQAGPCPRSEVLQMLGIGRSVLETMVKNGLLRVGQQDKKLPKSENLFSSDAYAESENGKNTLLPKLTEAQFAVTEVLTERMRQQNPKNALLHGVTGSGKTAVFLTLVHAALTAGKTALVLVPEIGLTPQMLHQLRTTFGSRVAVQHSALNATERLLQWRQIQRGDTPVVVGTRSAVFAPLENIGIIVVDEEQERSYQSESAPRYDAIAVARRRAAHHGALLLLASATPAISDYYLAMQGRYELFTLAQRYGNLPLPLVEMVDMRAELSAGNAGIISGRLVAEIEANIAAGQQTILLLNRRGYHRVGVCRECGEALKCTECSVPMVFHKASKRGAPASANLPGNESGGYLLCHYCGRTHNPAPQVCPECGGEIRYTGFGTQRMEEELAEKLPSARVLRMDLDSTSRKGSHTEMLACFAKGEYDVLLGTQMVAKGLDFEKVSLVGVIGIDSLLFSQGYRAMENVFSLVTQVVGRSGRAGAPGRALIQTMDPENPVLNLAAAQDYKAFYQQEIGFRKLALYPPFCSICVVGFVAQQEIHALSAARRFSALLAGRAKSNPSVPLRILGPAPMSVVQVAGSYRYRLTLKCRNDAEFRALAQETLDEYNKEGWPRKASVWLDFNSDAT